MTITDLPEELAKAQSIADIAALRGHFTPNELKHVQAIVRNANCALMEIENIVKGTHAPEPRRH
jgi:hypothetical protein